MAVKRLLDLALHMHSRGEGEGTCRMIMVDERSALHAGDLANLPELTCMLARLWLSGDIWMCDVTCEHCEWQARGEGRLPEEAAAKAFWAACGRLGMNFNE
jgi:hypothetical protein